MSIQTETPAQKPQARGDSGIYFIAVAALFLSFGVTMTVFTFFYMRDASTLLLLPGMVWDFLCGVPNANGATLPVLVLLSLASYLVAAVVGVVYWIRQRQHR
jgi:hypothetical protein